jgi:hypothetical protein
MTGVINGAGPIGIFLWGLHCSLFLVFCVVFCRSLLVMLYSVFWTWYCLSFDLQLLTTPFGILKLFVDDILTVNYTKFTSCVKPIYPKKIR